MDLAQYRRINNIIERDSADATYKYCPPPGRHRDLPAVLAPAGGRRRSGLVSPRPARREVAALLLPDLCIPGVHPAEERRDAGPGDRQGRLVPEALRAGHRLLPGPGRDLGLLQRLCPRHHAGRGPARVPDARESGPEDHHGDADEAPRLLAVKGALLGPRLRPVTVPALRGESRRPGLPDRALRPVLPLPRPLHGLRALRGVQSPGRSVS